MQKYIEFAQELLVNDIIPLPLLVDYAWPSWFEAKGAFEKSENTIDFIMFALYVLEHLENVTWWLTFNEPVRWIIAQYLQPKAPYTFYRAGLIINNMLEAHCVLYTIMKHKSPLLHIGLTHALSTIQPRNIWNPFELAINTSFDYLLHDALFTYFTTGKFNWLLLIINENLQAPHAIDFMGINHYAATTLDKIMPYKTTSCESSIDSYITLSKRIHKPLYKIQEPAPTNTPFKKQMHNILENLKKRYNMNGCFFVPCNVENNSIQ